MHLRRESTVIGKLSLLTLYSLVLVDNKHIFLVKIFEVATRTEIEKGKYIKDIESIKRNYIKCRY